MKAPLHHALGIVEYVLRLAAELDEDDFTTIDGGAGDQAATGGIGKAGLHPVVNGGAFQEFVRVFQRPRAAIGEGEGVSRPTYDATEQWFVVGAIGDFSHIPGCGVLIGGQAVWIDEMGVVRTHFPSLAIHEDGEAGDRSCRVAGQGGGGIIFTFHEHGREQVHPRIGLAAAYAELGGFHQGVGSLNGDRLHEIAPVDDDECGDEFLRAGDLSPRIRKFLIQGAAGAGVDEDS